MGSERETNWDTFFWVPLRNCASRLWRFQSWDYDRKRNQAGMAEKKEAERREKM